MKGFRLISPFIFAIFSQITLTAQSVTEEKFEVLKNTKNLVPVAVIGAGPAGLSAALYSARSQLKTVVFVGPKLGGTLSDVQYIENWPGKKRSSGAQAVEDLKVQAESFGAQLAYETIKSIDTASWPYKITTDDNDVFYALAIVFATGRTPRSLDIPGVKEFWGHGVGVCSICDAPFHTGDDVIVVGGGDTAVDRALQLAGFANKVYMIIKDDVMDAQAAAQEYVKNNKKIEVLYNTQLQEIDGDDAGVTKAVIKDTKTGESKTLDVQGVYFAVGWIPNSSLIKDILKLDKDGYIVLSPDGTHKTSTEGIFAAGDVTDHNYGKAGYAIGSGVGAGIDVISYLQNIGFTHDMAQKLHLEQSSKKKPAQKKSLAVQDNDQAITSNKEFNEILSGLQEPFIVEFYSKHCPTCRGMMKPVQNTTEQYKDKIKIFTLEHEDAKEIVQKYKIKSVPYFICFQNGKIIQRGTNIFTQRKLTEFIENILKNKGQQ